MKKLVEYTCGSHIYMKMELDGKIEEIDIFAGTDGSWNHYKTTGDSDPKRREKIIAAFNKMY